MSELLTHVGIQFDNIFKSILKPFCGAFDYNDIHISRLSPPALHLVKKACADIDPKDLLDCHVHILGSQQQYGNFLHSSYFSWTHPYMHLIALIMMSGFGVSHLDICENEILERLLRYINHLKPHGHYCLLAFDRIYQDDGSINEKKTRFFVSNEFVFKIAKEFPDTFIPIMSVHPYRKDAIEELEKWASEGAKVVKWVPNVMNIRPYDPRCIPYYEAMKKLDLTLLCHSGHEVMLTLYNDQKLANPLFLRYPLDFGIKVITAHCASLGMNRNLHFPKAHYSSNFDLFLELAQEKKYDGLLFADISAVTQVNRIIHLKQLLREAQPGGKLYKKLINGSDWPLPAFNISISTKLLYLLGFITKKERSLLYEIYRFDPLLFDFVHKRTLKHPITHEKFPKEIFMKNPLIPL